MRTQASLSQNAVSKGKSVEKEPRLPPSFVTAKFSLCKVLYRYKRTCYIILLFLGRWLARQTSQSAWHSKQLLNGREEEKREGEKSKESFSVLVDEIGYTVYPDHPYENGIIVSKTLYSWSSLSKHEHRIQKRTAALESTGSCSALFAKLLTPLQPVVRPRPSADLNSHSRAQIFKANTSWTEHKVHIKVCLNELFFLNLKKGGAVDMLWD